jgi:drug/metabolite transporter (DMT)-like permease
MLAVGLLASWGGTLCWNQASRLLPTSLTGQLIVFETLAALAYGFAHRGALPDAWTAAGIVLLVAGVIAGSRAFTPPAA